MTLRIDSDALAALLRQELARWGVPGAVAGVHASGDPVVASAGVTSLTDPRPVNEETRFRVASITKPFTATLAALLAGEGLLDLGAPVRRAVPELRLADAVAQETVTPRQLLAHLSGLECEPPHHDVEHGADDGALARAVAAFPGVDQLTPPGEIWSYCNTGYWLAGHAVARAAGTPFEEAARELLLAPLGMTGSCFVHDGVAPPGAALGHAPRAPGDPQHDVVPGYRFLRSRVPSGGLVSTVPDLLRFAALHLDATGAAAQTAAGAAAPGSPHSAALAHLQEPAAAAVGVHWGTGWSVDTSTGARVVAHSGSYGGFQSQLALVPAAGLAVAVLTNSGRGSAVVRAVVEWVLAEALGLRSPEPLPVADELVRHQGLYRARNLDVEVRVTGDRLRVAQRTLLPSGDTAAPPPLVGLAVAPGLFVVPDGEARGARFDFPSPGRLRVSGRLALRDD